MKDYQELKTAAFHRLEVIFGAREAKSILRILEEDLFTGPKQTLNDEWLSAWDRTIDRVLADEPLSYITGIHYFLDLKLKMAPGALIPRPETEELVVSVLDDLKRRYHPSIRILDIGTGSGCIPLAIKSKYPGATIFTLDISAQALSIASANAQALDLDLNFIRQDFLNETLWDQLPAYLDIVVSNPPYIQDHEVGYMTRSTILYEPSEALFAGADPLIFYKKIAVFSFQHLKPGGAIFLEINEFLGEETRQIFDDMGFDHVRVLKDLGHKDRILVCEKAN